MKRLHHLPLGIYEKAICFSLAWEEKLSLIQNCGYDFLEINIDGEEPRINRLYDKESAKKLAAAIRGTGIPVLSLALTANRKYPLGSEDDGTRKKAVEVVCRAIDFALEAGIRIIQLAPYYGGDESPGGPGEKRLYASMEQCVVYAHSHCVTLSFEVIDTQGMKSIRQIMQVVRAFDSAFLQAYADIGNLHAMGVDVEDDLPAGGRHIVGVHIKDSRLQVVRDIPYGEGIVDFNKSFRTLSGMGYDGILVAEMWCHEDPGFHEYLGQANRFIRQAVAEY